jgi:hypothetical protein
VEVSPPKDPLVEIVGTPTPEMVTLSIREVPPLAGVTLLTILKTRVLCLSSADIELRSMAKPAFVAYFVVLQEFPVVPSL